MSLNTGGWAQAETPGTATISAFWRAFIYTDGGSSGCESGLLHPFVETLCNVFDSPVIFTRASAKTRTSRETSAQFEGIASILTANLDDPDCPGDDRISVIVSFLLPSDTASLLPQPDTRVTLDGDNKYRLISVSNPELLDNLDRGFFEFVVQRRFGTNAGGTSNKITVRIAGRRNNGVSFTGTANVKLICAL
jgi:hypothetical protein